MRGKDEEKVISPMFPRLHVNDKEKGGPRAPPRNKMALFGQFSNPCQRFSSGSAASMLLPPKNGSNSVHSMSSSHGGGHERNEFTPFGNSPAPSDLSERLHSHSSSGVRQNTMMASQVQKSVKPASYQSLNATRPLSSIATSNSFRPYNVSNFKDFSLKRLGDKDDYRAPTFAHPGIAPHCSNSQHGKDWENVPRLNLNSSMHLQTTCEKQMKGIGTIDLNSRQYVRNRDEDRAKVSQTSRDHEESRTIQVRDLERHDDVLDTSMMDSISVLNVSTDVVVGVIGEKQFWKARRAIVNQQRVFAVQVFELHRLIKVQRLIAGSPHLLLEDNFLLGKPSLYVSPMKKLPSEYVLEPPPIVKPKDHSQKPNTSIECEDENAVPKLPFPSVNNDTSRGFVTQRSSYGPSLGNKPPTPLTTNTKPSPWCFTPPVNQWLVPVMSPSEGLVYKPYRGQWPPTKGFMAPGYSSCGPMSLTSGGREFLNAADCVPASHQQGIGILPGTPPLLQTYFPPYGMPFMNPSISGSAVEQVSPFTGVQSKGNQLSMGDTNITIPQQSSGNMSSQTIKVISCCVGKFQAWKESEVQGSTACSPSERAKGDELPLFPMEPTVSSDQNAQNGEQQTQAIKVVPHNPRSATESAARIFRSIQEERKQYDRIFVNETYGGPYS